MMTKTTQPGAEPANVFEDRAAPGQWRVEWFDDDGRCELEIFHRPRCATASAAVRYAKVRAFQRSAATRAAGRSAALTVAAIHTGKALGDRIDQGTAAKFWPPLGSDEARCRPAKPE